MRSCVGRSNESGVVGNYISSWIYSSKLREGRLNEI